MLACLKGEFLMHKLITAALLLAALLMISVVGVAQTQGGTLTMVEYSEPDMMDPHASYSRHSVIVLRQICDNLVVVDNEGVIQPHLATSWEVSADATQYTFYLREDVTFHDGTPFNAEAVKYNFDRIVDPATKAMMFADQLGAYVSADVLDEFTVRINLSETMGPFMLFTATSVFMVSPTAAEAIGVDDFGFNPVGSGPFKWVSWTPQDKIVLERNEDYNWGPEAISNHTGPAYVDQVIIKYITEAATRSAVMETREAQIVIRPSEYDMAGFRADPEVDVYQSLVPGLPTTFVMNTNKAPFDDVRVRQAVNYWLDRDLIVATVWANEFPVAHGVLAPITLGYNAAMETYYTQDQAKAVALLEDAGWVDSNGDGVRDQNGVDLSVAIYSCGDYIEPPEALEPQLRSLGFATKITMVPWSEQKRVVYNGDPHMMVATFNSIDPNVLRLLFHSENAGENGWYWSHLNEADPALAAELDGLLEQGDRESDDYVRMAIYQRVQEIIATNGIAIPLRVDAYNMVVDAKLGGWTTHLDGWPMLYNMWLDK